MHGTVHTENAMVGSTSG